MTPIALRVRRIWLRSLQTNLPQFLFTGILFIQVFNGTMPDVVITADNICWVLQDLNCDSAVEPDYVHPRVLKACACIITVPLTMI